MATTASAFLDLSIRLRESWDSGANAFDRDILGKNRPLVVRQVNGSTAGKVDVIYVRQQASIAASSSATIQLRGSLTDEEGGTITLATLKGLFVINTNTAGTITVTPESTNGVSGLIVGTAGTDGPVCLAARTADEPGFLYWHCGGGLTIGASSDGLTLINNDGSNAITPTVGFYGVSA